MNTSLFETVGVAPPAQLKARVNPALLAQLAPTGVLRAGINLSNFLLVTGRGEQGEPQGVAPHMAAAIAEVLGVGLVLVPYKGPGLLADAAQEHVWDIGLIGAEPARAQFIAFSSAYVEIEATYLVRADSKFQNASEVDAPGVRIVVSQRTAYELWLSRNLQHAELILAEGFDGALARFQADGLDALAGLRPGLMGDVQKVPGVRILDGRFTAIQQAIGTHKGNQEAADFLQDFSQYAIHSGLVAALIKHHQVQGLSVAPPASAS
jgi:polar amino acid transport system substrate-binding protein